MRFIVIIGAIVSVSLAGCGSEERVAEVEPVVQEEAAAPPAEEIPAPAPEAGEDEKPELVEESVGEPEEEEEKPILLAEAEPAAAERDWKFSEGQHYSRMVPTQPTVGGADKIEVAEFFWYGCGHCLTFEPYINRWDEGKPANVRFVRVPALWNALVRLHGQMYYTEEVLVKNGKIADPKAFRAAVFAEYHQRQNRLTSESAIMAFFARFGVSEDDFTKTWSSFEVAQKLRVAQDLARRYTISGVPAIVVNGKYRTGRSEAGGYPELLEVIDELVERETLR